MANETSFYIDDYFVDATFGQPQINQRRPFKIEAINIKTMDYYYCAEDVKNHKWLNYEDQLRHLPSPNNSITFGTDGSYLIITITDMHGQTVELEKKVFENADIRLTTIGQMLQLQALVFRKEIREPKRLSTKLWTSLCWNAATKFSGTTLTPLTTLVQVIEFASPAHLSLTFNGHGIVNGGYMYLTFLVDDKVLPELSQGDYPKDLYGRFHMYPLGPEYFQPVNLTQHTFVSKGKHKISIGMQTQCPNTIVTLRGCAIQIISMPADSTSVGNS